MNGDLQVCVQIWYGFGFACEIDDELGLASIEGFGCDVRLR